MWIKPYEQLRAPYITNLRMDPFERAQDDSIHYGQYFIDHVWVVVPAAGYLAQWLQSFKEFPPRQKPGSFNLDRVMDDLTKKAN